MNNLKVYLFTNLMFKHIEEGQVVIAASLKDALKLAAVSKDDYPAGKWEVEERPVAPGVVAFWTF